MARLQPGKPDHALGEIDDLDRLPHVEHVNRYVRTHRRQRVRGGGDHEVAGLADGHEIPDHVGMSDRHRTARLDLGLELGHDRSVRRQHIAESHGDQPHPWLAV